MIAFAYYLLKVIVCSGILFLYYQLFLRNRIFHHWNRFYLLALVVLSLCLPFIKLNLTAPQQGSSDVLNYIFMVQSADHYLEEYTVYYHPQFSKEDWLLLGYSVVSAALFVALMVSLYKIARLVKRHAAKTFDQFILLPTRVPGSPFSFLHYIFWNEDIPLHSEAGKKIFQHELVHVREKHTWDKLFMQAVLVFFWCNPFFWLIRKELRFVHEFIADKKAVGSDTEAFALMILQSTYPKQLNALHNPFFQSSIKRRLAMLTQLKNPRVAYISRVAVLPLMATIVMAFTARTVDPSNSGAKMKSGLAISDTIPKKAVEIQAVDVRKSKELNINEVEIYYADGRREVLSEKEANARGLIHNGGYGNARQKGTNGAVQKSGLELRGISEAVLFVLDGKEVSRQEVEKLNPSMVQRVNVLKGSHATAAYGERGKNGVVELQTKTQASDEPMTLLQSGQPIIKGKVTELRITNTDSVHFEADEISVIGEKSQSNDGEVVVVGRKLENQPVFEKAEFAPSIDQVEWRKFLEKYTLPIIEDIGRKMPTGSYTVNVRFIVEKDGSITEVKVLNDPGYGLGSKVYEIMRHAPKWKPAIQNQRVVRSYHTQPITFVIAET